MITGIRNTAPPLPKPAQPRFGAFTAPQRLHAKIQEIFNPHRADIENPGLALSDWVNTNAATLFRSSNHGYYSNQLIEETLTTWLNNPRTSTDEISAFFQAHAEETFPYFELPNGIYNICCAKLNKPTYTTKN